MSAPGVGARIGRIVAIADPDDARSNAHLGSPPAVAAMSATCALGGGEAEWAARSGRKAARGRARSAAAAADDKVLERPAQALDGLDHRDHHLLRIAVHERGVVGIEQLVLDARIAFALAALDHVGLLGLIHVQDRHAVDGAALVGARGRIHGVVRADDERHVGFLEFAVDVFHVEDDVVGHAGLGEQHVHVARHAAGHRVDRELHLDAGFLQQLHELIELVLGLRHRRGRSPAR